MPRPALALLVLLASAALAQTAGRDVARRGGADPVAKYHEGAQAFIGGDVAAAAAAVRAGLQAAPDSERLQKLRDLIEQDQEEQDQRRGGQQDRDAENQDTEGERDDAGQSSGQGQQDPPDEQEPGAGRDRTDTQNTPPGESGEGQDGPEGQGVGEGGPTPEGDAAVPEGRMSRAQAERILDAVGGDERLLLRELRRQSQPRARRTDKDW